MSNPAIYPSMLAQHLAQVGAVSAVSGSASQSVPQPRLIKAAHEFEAAMMKELLAPLSSGKDLLGGGEEEGSGSALNGFAQEALGEALSEHGGFGIAKGILRQLSANGNHSGNSPVPGNLRPHPTNLPSK